MENTADTPWEMILAYTDLQEEYDNALDMLEVNAILELAEKRYAYLKPEWYAPNGSCLLESDIDWDGLGMSYVRPRITLPQPRFPKTI